MHVSRPAIAAAIGTVVMVLTDVAHYTSGLIPAQYLVYINAAIAVLTWVSVNILHIKVVTQVKTAAHDAGYKAGVAAMKRK